MSHIFLNLFDTVLNRRDIKQIYLTNCNALFSFSGKNVMKIYNGQLSMLQQCEKQLSVLNITLLRKQAEMEVSRKVIKNDSSLICRNYMLKYAEGNGIIVQVS